MTRVLVVGGGISGITAALKSAQAGYDVTLIESRPYLGGRAYSYWDSSQEEWIDNCQHIIMGCCREITELLKELDVYEKIKWYDKYRFLYDSKQISELTSSILPAPFHLIPSFFNNQYYGTKDKIRLCRSIAKLWLTETVFIEPEEIISAEAWLLKAGQSECLMNGFWHPLIVSAFNTPANEVPWTALKQSIELAFLGNKDGYRLGVFTNSLNEIFHQAAMRKLTEHNVHVLLNTSINTVHWDELAKVRGLISKNQEMFYSDVYISCLPNMRSAVLFNSHKQRCFKPSPIMSLHLWVKDEITQEDYLCLPGRKIHWMFNKNKQYDRSLKTNQYLTFVISAAYDLMDKTNLEIQKLLLPEILEIFPKLENTQIEAVRILREPGATFRFNISFSQKRPYTYMGGNVLFSGDYTDTDWPGTMEGSVISGINAVEILKSLWKP